MATLEELRERVASLDADRVQKQKEAAETLERATLEDEIAISELSDIGVRGIEHEVVRAAASGHLVVLRVPKPIHWTAYIRASKKAGDGDQEKVEQNFVESCLVFPDRAKLRGYLESEPGFLVRLSLCANALAGLRDEASLKK
jgi:hypothetical protein